MLATSVREPFSRSGWIFELKHDGFRILLEKKGRAVRLITRKGMDLAEAFPEIVVEAEQLPDLVVDGELVILDEHGKSRFESLRQRAGMTRVPPQRAGGQEVAAIFAFDLLWRGDEDLRALASIKRKAILQHLLWKGVYVRYLQHIDEEGEALYRSIADANLEGMVAKRATAPYRAGRSRYWLEVKTPAFKLVEKQRFDRP